MRREGLFDRLSAIPRGGVGLVCAPAGSGKTMLLRSWTEQTGDRVAWISVEPGERDAQHFWNAVIDALAAASVPTTPHALSGAIPCPAQL